MSHAQTDTHTHRRNISSFHQSLINGNALTNPPPPKKNGSSSKINNYQFYIYNVTIMSCALICFGCNFDALLSETDNHIY